MIHYLYLGRMGYAEALRLQEELAALRQQGRIHNVLLLLEHPPVLTLGRNASRANILASDQLLASRGVTLHEINRGGDVTYHGPGQLIGYPIFDLRSLRNPNGGRLGPVDFVRLMEEALIRLCAVYGVQAGRICGLTGVWCGAAQPGCSSEGTPCAAPRPEAKIAAIGIHVARGVTSHGFAFNVTTDLRDFSLINPCGITDRPVTSLQQELARESAAGVAHPAAIPSLEEMADEAARQFGIVFHQQLQAVASLDDLRAQANETGSANPPEPESPAAESPAPEFPAQDTPLQVPPELERLRGVKDRPLNA
jgi:lipoyl(octanoyl) transferase